MRRDCSEVVDVHLRSDSRNYTAALLSADKGKVALIQAAAVVSVDKVDARKLVLHEHLAVSNSGHWPRLLDLERRGRAGLMHNGSLIA